MQVKSSQIAFNIRCVICTGVTDCQGNKKHKTVADIQCNQAHNANKFDDSIILLLRQNKTLADIWLILCTMCQLH